MNTLLITAAALVICIGAIVLAMGVRRLRHEGSLYPPAGTESETDIERLKQAGETVLAVRCYRAVHKASLADAYSAVTGRPAKRGAPAIFFLSLILLIIAALAALR